MYHTSTSSTTQKKNYITLKKTFKRDIVILCKNIEFIICEKKTYKQNNLGLLL